MMAERINEAADAPGILFVDGPHFSGSSRDRPVKSGIRTFHGHHYADRATTERLRTEIAVVGGLVSHPKLRPING